MWGSVSSVWIEGVGASVLWIEIGGFGGNYQDYGYCNLAAIRESRMGFLVICSSESIRSHIYNPDLRTEIPN